MMIARHKIVRPSTNSTCDQYIIIAIFQDYSLYVGWFNNFHQGSIAIIYQ